ncbi:MAG: sigma-70 family RNA polymerase sigma factor [Myxococcales bacterium]|jgi:RNA polymerase sigma-70 factor (ECF subfamily)
MAAEQRRFIERLRRRDEAAFNELVRRHQQPVFRLLCSMLGDRAEAEDVAQEVFVSVFKAIESFRGDAQLSTWLYRVAVNHGKNRIKYLARRARDAQRPLDESVHGEPGDGAPGVVGERPDAPDHAVEGKQAHVLMQRALASLDEEQRTLVVLRDLQHLSYDEIQRVTELPIGTVKSRLHRARVALQARYRALSEGTP